MPSNRKTAEIKTEKEKKKMKHLMPGKEKVKKKSKHAMSEEDQQAHEPKMKKQKMEKKEEQDQDLSPEEKRILERKLKKERKKEEKRLMREAGVIAKKEVPKKPSGLESALNYLTSWSENPKEWKFQKTRQTWLLTHMYDKEKVPDKYFSILLRYLEGLQGNARDTTVQKAEALMKEYDKSETEDSALLESCERLRKVLQLLS